MHFAQGSPTDWNKMGRSSVDEYIFYLNSFIKVDTSVYLETKAIRIKMTKSMIEKT